MALSAFKVMLLAEVFVTRIRHLPLSKVTSILWGATLSANLVLVSTASPHFNDFGILKVFMTVRDCLG